jgi:formate hydrogenlyase subunit 6/NADH:ubiquinone oxidoreductase subunit I
MAHHTLKSSYDKLTERLNKFPQGAPPSETLEKILKIIIKDKEAELISQLPIKPFTVEKAAKVWNLSIGESEKVLNELASRAILVDVEKNGQSTYVLPPPMAGFFEFSMMRLRDDIDQKVLGELFYQYLNVEEDFVKNLFTDGDTQLGRTFVHEPVLSNENALHVLDYERASEVVKTASHRAVGMCYCRHKMEHMGTACDAPMDICMTFNASAESLSKHGHAREIDVAEGLDLLQQAYDHNLVQFGENVRESVNFICNCCGCCCEAMLAAKRFAYENPIHTTNFLPEIKTENCTGCGKCVDVCPVEAMTLVSASDPHKPKRKIAKLDADICLGCGVCVRSCSTDALSLKQREQRVITPLNGAHKAVVMALERGKLQNLIFDNQVLLSHRALAAVLGVILKLPPLKQALATQQVKSRYLESLVKKYAN